MRNSLREFSGFVGEMNELARHSDAEGLARWAVRQLSRTVGFDCAWYGWAELKTDAVEIHAQSQHNLTDTYYDSWCEMAEQDLLAAAIRQQPGRTAVYERYGGNQTEGMISLADRYGLKQMATAMQSRPGRTGAFYLSGYRGGQHSRTWSAQELDYLQCAVDQLSSVMTLSAAKKEIQGGGGHSIFVNRDGIVLLGLQNVQGQLKTFWPEWSGDQLPEQLRSLINITGEHVLVDRQLIVTCNQVPGINKLDLRKLTLRQLTKFDLLTRREREVAALLADGNSHKETARELGVAPATVRNQTQSIYVKLGVSCRAELALEVRARSKEPLS